MPGMDLHRDGRPLLCCRLSTSKQLHLNTHFKNKRILVEQLAEFRYRETVTLSAVAIFVSTRFLVVATPFSSHLKLTVYNGWFEISGTVVGPSRIERSYK